MEYFKKRLMRNLFLSWMALGFLFTSCKPNQKEEMRSKDWSFKPEATLQLIAATNDTLKELQVVLADTGYSIRLGMMYREELTEDQGMLFIFEKEIPQFFYTKNTEVPIDIIYITANKRVDSYSLIATPKGETLSKSKGAAQYVLEVKAGMVEQWGLKEGDLVDWKTIPPPVNQVD
jgi:uncharacterized membrane protein (UPF0127 family)